jgi:hypothetical protein
MANPTTNFGWVMPTSTDLVTDLPADFNVFGQGVDTSMADLLGGTTGQVLSKTSGTNMDFTWVTPTDQTPLTTKGDLFTFTTVDARLGIGANDTVLTADSAQATGMKWATPSASSMTSIASGSIANSATGFSLTSIVGTYNNLQLVIRNSYSAADINSRIRVNNDATSIYSNMQNYGLTTTASATAATGTNFLIDNYNSSKAASTSIYVINFWDYAGNAFKCGTVTGFHQDRTTGNYEIMTQSFGIQLTAAINRIDLITGNANTFAGAGTYTLYGVK